MASTFLDLSRQLNKKDIPRVSLVYGEEAFFIQSLKDLFKKQVMTETENISTYDLSETSIQDVIADAETYPFFGEQKLIFATNPVFFKSKTKKLPFEHDLSVLERYVKSPPDYSILVFIAEYEKIDNRKTISKLFKKHAVIAACHPIKEYETEKWVKSIANSLHVTIDKEAIDALDPELMRNLQLLQSEFKKLALYVGEGGNITRDIVEKLIAHTPQSSSLRLVDTVIAGDLYKAMSIYKDLMKLNEDQIALIGLLAFQFRMIFRVKLLKQKGYAQTQIQRNIGAHPYVIKIALQRERQFSIKQLKYMINRLADTDEIMKQGKMDKNIAFELLLYDLIKAS